MTDTTITPATETPAEVDRRMFKFSTWLHVGPDAENCEDREGVCGDASHFHAWLRLPNQIQHEEIRERALAAKARRVRVLKDPDSDAHVVLESELDELRSAGEGAREPIIHEVLQRTFWQTYAQATREVMEQEDPDSDDGAKRWEHLDRDQGRLQEILALPADEQEQAKDELAELEKHLTAFHEAVQKHHDQLQEPEREVLRERDFEELIDNLRRDRINRDATKVFDTMYARLEWATCTLRGEGGEPIFDDEKGLKKAAPEVLDALEDAFNDLEGTRNRALAGNS